MGSRRPNTDIAAAAHQSYPLIRLPCARGASADMQIIIPIRAPTVEDKPIGSRRIPQKNVARRDMQTSEGGGRTDADVLPFQQRPGADEQAPNDEYASHMHTGFGLDKDTKKKSTLSRGWGGGSRLEGRGGKQRLQKYRGSATSLLAHLQKKPSEVNGRVAGSILSGLVSLDWSFGVI